MAIRIRRREFIITLGSVATLPLAARAQQQPTLPMIGFLSSLSSRESLPVSVVDLSGSACSKNAGLTS
jgi:hypothetical protein